MKKKEILKKIKKLFFCLFKFALKYAYSAKTIFLV